MTTLFDPFRFGDIDVATRIVMAPLTRNRAPQQLPNDLMRDYYAQRADPATGAGLVITEASQVCAMGQGYLDTPGIYTAEQVAGWRRITEAVHTRGGRIAIQLWHVGRISHSSLLNGAAPVSSTARAANGKTFTTEGFVPTSTPRALAESELAGVVAAYRHATRCAMDAGFDGVEVHGANGYLIEQFLRDSINDRSDAYGGPVAHRIRLLQEVLAAVVAEAGAGRTGLRLSPITPVNDAAQDSHAATLYGAVVAALAPLQLAFLHIIEGQTGGARDLTAMGIPAFDYAALRSTYLAGRARGEAGGAAWMVNNGYSRAMALDVVAQGQADLVAFGRPFIANPDLGLRLRQNAPLNALKQPLLYGGGAAGYTDYPTLAETAAAAQPG